MNVGLFWRSILGRHHSASIPAEVDKIYHSAPVMKKPAKTIDGAHLLMKILTKIPVEVKDEILTHLSIADLVCLALTCKSLYSHCLEFLKSQDIELSQPFPREERPMIGGNIDYMSRPRLQLLHQLQDSRWKFCSGCWNLHRHSAWEPDRYQYTSPNKPKCMPYAGMIDICPCSTVTFPDKFKLIQTWQRVRQTVSQTLKKQSCYDGALHMSVGEMNLKHECILTGHPLSDVQVTTKLMWWDYNGSLEVSNEYTFQNSKTFKDLRGLQEMSFQKQVSRLGIKTVSMCPNDNPQKWLRQFFHEAGLNLHGPNSTCRVKTLNYNEKTIGHVMSYDRLRIVVTRRLEGAKWPDAKPGDSYLI